MSIFIRQFPVGPMLTFLRPMRNPSAMRCASFDKWRLSWPWTAPFQQRCSRWHQSRLHWSENASTGRLLIDLRRSWPDLDLTWGQIFKLTFQGQKVHVANRLDEPNRMVSFLFSYLSYQKSYQWKTISVKNDNFLFDDLCIQICWP